VAAAFAKRPQVVRDALLEAIRHVQLRTTDINLLRIESAFHSTLKKPWKEPKNLRPVLEACRQRKLKSKTESLFFEHGEESGVVALCVATNQDDHKLFREIDPLPDDELIKLVRNVQTIPKRAALVEFVEEFVQSPKGIVSDPPPRLPRPRTRRKGHVSLAEISPSPPPANPDSSNISQRNKRRRLGSVSDTIAQGLPRVESRLPSADDNIPSAVSRPLPPPPTFPLQSALSNYPSLSISKHANIQQQSLSGQEEERWSMPPTTGSHISINNPQQSQMMSLEEPWEFAVAEGEFTRGRPRRYDPGQPQWEFTGGEFTQGRPYRYDPEPLRIGQEAQWLFMEQEFTQGRPDRYDPQSAQVQEQNGFQL